MMMKSFRNRVGSVSDRNRSEMPLTGRGRWRLPSRFRATSTLLRIQRFVMEATNRTNAEDLLAW